MKKFTLYIFAIFLFNSSAFAEPDRLSIVLTGSREDVLSVVRKAIETEFSDGQISNWNGAIGYWVAFRSFFTGQSGLGVALRPMVNSDATEANAYQLMFSVKTNLGNGNRHIRSLIDQIGKQTVAQRGVAIASNPEAYRTLRDQAVECYKKLAGDPELEALSKKVALSRTDAVSLIMLADESKPTLTEKPIIALWAAKRDICANLMKIEFSFFPSDKNGPIQQFQMGKANELILALYKGDLTYGEYSSKRKALGLEALQKLYETTAAQNKDRTEAEALQVEKDRMFALEAQRVAAEQQKAQAMQTQANKSIQPQFVAPTQTNCTSRAVLGTIQTTCN